MRRAKVLVIEGLKIGAGLALFLSVFYMLVVVSVISDIGQQPDVETAIIGLLSILLFAGVWIFVIGVIPATMVGITGGMLIGAVLALWKKKISDILACLIGFTGGLSVVLLAYYLSWLNMIHSNPYPHHSTFMEYLLPLNIYDLEKTILYDPFFIPSIIAIMVAPFVGWKINTIDIMSTIPLAEE